MIYQLIIFDLLFELKNYTINKILLNYLKWIGYSYFVFYNRLAANGAVNYLEHIQLRATSYAECHKWLVDCKSVTFKRSGTNLV